METVKEQYNRFFGFDINYLDVPEKGCSVRIEDVKIVKRIKNPGNFPGWIVEAIVTTELDGKVGDDYIECFFKDVEGTPSEGDFVKHIIEETRYRYACEYWPLDMPEYPILK